MGLSYGGCTTERMRGREEILDGRGVSRAVGRSRTSAVKERAERGERVGGKRRAGTAREKEGEGRRKERCLDAAEEEERGERGSRGGRQR